MKLAEALQERADLNRRVAQLRERLSDNALVQEGERPAEDPAEMLIELDRSIDRLEALIAGINRANSDTVSQGETLTQLLARRDALKLRVEAYQQLLRDASQTWQRATGSEIRVLSAVDVKSLRRRSDDLARDLRKLDNRIQALNWTTDVEI